MKTNKRLLIALVAILLLCIGLAIDAIVLRNRLSVLENDTDDYMIMDTADPSESVLPGKKPAINAAQNPGTKDAVLEGIIEQELNGAGGNWDVWVEPLGNSMYAHMQSAGTHRMVSASLIKLFIMGTVYQAVDEGSIDNDDVYADIRNMITISDNDAANRLIRELGNGNEQDGITRINQFAEDIGCMDTQMNRLMLENNGLENYTSAEDCAKLLKLIYNGQCINAKWSAEMMSIMKEQQVNDRIPQGLPRDVVVAHKTANLTNLANADVGIVFADNRPYIICIINNNSPDDTATNGQIAALSEAVYDYYQTN